MACRVIGEELARLNFARMRIDSWLLTEDADWPEVTTRYHHMGTTRMADDPRRGVVDRDCRVHGVDNLYIAGSSLFPTGGYATPTLTIVALAARLAHHLARGSGARAARPVGQDATPEPADPAPAAAAD